MSTLPPPDPSCAPRASAPAAQRRLDIDLHEGAMPVRIPDSHIGEVVIPGTGRRVWWTGRVAIGLRYEGGPPVDTPSQSALWVQHLLLGTRGRRPQGR